MARPKSLRAAEDVVPRLGVRPVAPALRIGDVATYDRPLEHLAGHLDRAELDLPLRFFASRYGVVLAFACYGAYPALTSSRGAGGRTGSPSVRH